MPAPNERFGAMTPVTLKQTANVSNFPPASCFVGFGKNVLFLGMEKYIKNVHAKI